MKGLCERGLCATLECLRTVVIDLPDKDWRIEKGEMVDCIIFDEEIKLILTRDITYTTSVSNVSNFFEIV